MTFDNFDINFRLFKGKLIKTRTVLKDFKTIFSSKTTGGNPTTDHRPQPSGSLRPLQRLHPRLQRQQQRQRRQGPSGANVIKLFTAVIYSCSMVIPSFCVMK